MPIIRYFLWIGGALLALLFYVDHQFPSIGTPEHLEKTMDKTSIRIQSTQKWPERVVIDTRLPTLSPATSSYAAVSEPRKASASELGKRDALVELSNEASLSTVRSARAEVPSIEKKRKSRTAKNVKRFAAREKVEMPQTMGFNWPVIGF